ncbi:hypothetical protein [Polyangium fumosum]|uniref:Uncharacterized protein n=1 Tax=Polyangium fumosum TaxID=889272 RepID=A0A4U1J2P5_9BACT|nr:hypothetical protein [Polyangium fumosum]TKD00890.1 hypothetical protein E8A74_32600 [Polyangium fumosum]
MMTTTKLSLVLLAATTLLACSRAPKPSSRHDAVAPVGSVSPVANASDNPFVHPMPPTTARIVYEKHDGSLRMVFHVKNGRVRAETTGGMFAGDDYTVSDGESEVRVFPKQRKVIRFRTAAAHLFEEYRKLGPEAQAAVRRSIDLVLPDLPFYQEGPLEALDVRDIHGLKASCYRRTSQILTSVSEACFWRGIRVWLMGKNPIDGSDLRAGATDVVLGPALDDELFVIPSDYTQELGSTDEIMHGVYASLLERMQSPRFSIAHLDRYAQTP